MANSMEDAVCNRMTLLASMVVWASQGAFINYRSVSTRVGLRHLWMAGSCPTISSYRQMIRKAYRPITCEYSDLSRAKTGLYTFSERHRLKCLRSLMVAYAGDRGSNPAACTILVLFFWFLFSLDVRSSLYSAYSVILKHWDIDTRFIHLSGLSSAWLVGKPVAATWLVGMPFGPSVCNCLCPTFFGSSVSIRLWTCVRYCHITRVEFMNAPYIIYAVSNVYCAHQAKDDHKHIANKTKTWDTKC